MFKRTFGAVFLLLVFCGVSLASHPLITDDTGTQGKGRYELEFGYEFDHEHRGGVKENIHHLESTISYGIVDSVDLIVHLPYQFVTTKGGGRTTREDGLADMTVELKWRFFERKGLSFALKPGLSIPTGDDDRGLGAGKVGGSFHFIATQIVEPWAFHFNAGYGRNENTLAEEIDIWHVSLAADLAVCRWANLVANIGAEQNTDKNDNTPAAFILGGLIIPVSDNFALSFGVKGGLTEPESDYTLLAGVTFWF